MQRGDCFSASSIAKWVQSIESEKHVFEEGTDLPSEKRLRHIDSFANFFWNISVQRRKPAFREWTTCLDTINYVYVKLICSPTFCKSKNVSETCFLFEGLWNFSIKLSLQTICTNHRVLSLEIKPSYYFADSWQHISSVRCHCKRAPFRGSSILSNSIFISYNILHHRTEHSSL